LEGLDVTIMQLSAVGKENRVFRIDSQYFSKAAIATEFTLKKGRWETLGQMSSHIRSFGAYALTNQFTYTDEGVPFLRCLNIKNGFVEFANVLFIPPAANTLLSKSTVEPETVYSRCPAQSGKPRSRCQAGTIRLTQIRMSQRSRQMRV
jgi:hypothetical protein